MGSPKGSQGNSTLGTQAGTQAQTGATTSASTPNPATLSLYNDFLDRTGALYKGAEFDPRTLGQVAPWDESMAAAQQNGLNAGIGAGNPTISEAQRLIQGPIQLHDFDAGQVDRYMSPYTQRVVDTTQNQFNNQNAIQGNSLIGKAIASGNAFGGDRAGVAAAELGGQQQLAQAPVIAGLYQSGYGQALDQYNRMQQLALGIQGLGMQGLSAGAGLNMTGADLAMRAAPMRANYEQRVLDTNQRNAMQEQAYPFQMANWYGSTLGGMGPLTGTQGSTAFNQFGSTTGNTSTTPPPPNTLTQLAGLGLAGAGLAGQLNKSGLLGSSGGGGLTDSFDPRFTVEDPSTQFVARRGGLVPRRAMGGPMGGPMGMGMPPPFGDGMQPGGRAGSAWQPRGFAGGGDVGDDDMPSFNLGSLGDDGVIEPGEGAHAIAPPTWIEAPHYQSKPMALPLATVPNMSWPSVSNPSTAAAAKPSDDSSTLGTIASLAGTAAKILPLIFAPGGLVPHFDEGGDVEDDVISGGLGNDTLGAREDDLNPFRVGRERFADSIAANPALKERLFRTVAAEDPRYPGAQMEAIFNRANSRNQPLEYAAADPGYYPRVTRRGVNPEPYRGSFEDALANVLGGSNDTRGATGNASLGVGFGYGRGARDPYTLRTGSGERYGHERADLPWITSMGQETMMGGSGEDRLTDSPSERPIGVGASRGPAYAGDVSALPPPSHEEIEPDHVTNLPGIRPRTGMQEWASNPLTRAGLAMMNTRSPNFLSGLGQGASGAADALEAEYAERQKLDTPAQMITQGSTIRFRMPDGRLLDTGIKTITEGQRQSNERIRDIAEMNRGVKIYNTDTQANVKREAEEGKNERAGESEKGKNARATEREGGRNDRNDTNEQGRNSRASQGNQTKRDIAEGNQTERRHSTDTRADTAARSEIGRNDRFDKGQEGLNKRNTENAEARRATHRDALEREVDRILKANPAMKVDEAYQRAQETLARRQPPTAPQQNPVKPAPAELDAKEKKAAEALKSGKITVDQAIADAVRAIQGGKNKAGILEKMQRQGIQPNLIEEALRKAGAPTVPTSE